MTNFADNLLGEFNTIQSKKKSNKKSNSKSKESLKVPTTKMENIADSSGVTSRKLPIFEIDPSLCRPWKYHNRDENWLNSKKCDDLISSIRENGQQEPALLREINDGNYKYEIIYGLRRWYSCSQIPGQKLLAKLTKASDKECMILMHVENADSKDITDFERAFSFKQQYESGLFKSQQEFSKAMNVAQSTVAKMLAAASLFDYDFIHHVLKDKTVIPVKRAYKLVSLLKNKHSRALADKTCKDILDRIHNGEDIATGKALKLIENSLLSDEGEIVSEIDGIINSVPGMKGSIDSSGNISLKISCKTDPSQAAKALKKALSL